MNEISVFVITIFDHLNLGNRLQNYAVQEVLNKLNCNAVTVVYQKPPFSIKEKTKYFLQRISGFCLPGDKVYWKLFPKRLEGFLNFNKAQLNLVYIHSVKQIKDYSYYIVGSDQVWNPKWYEDNPLKKDLFLLTFADDNQKVCFSSSFGVTQLPEEWKPWFKKYLSKIPKISVREEAGAKIVKELTGKEATVLIDPTLMLDVSDWLRISKTPKRVDLGKPYILTYFLGGRSNRVDQDLEKFSKDYKLDIYNLLDQNQPDLYVTGPSEFISLVANAQLILTDSFHACVFSFLFNKPFLVYDREGTENDMMSRIDTFLSKFSIRRKYVDSGMPNDVMEHDYSQGYQQLAIERQKVLDFLRDSMNLSEDKGQNDEN